MGWGEGGGGGGWGDGIWVNPLKKENSRQISFFSDNVVWSSKNYWKMISADVKSNIKEQKIKDLVTASDKFL